MRKVTVAAVQMACAADPEQNRRTAAEMVRRAAADGAQIILLPELPYDIKKVAAAVENRAKAGKNFSILAVAEGAFSTEEAKMKRKEWTAKRAEAGYTTATARIAKQVEELTGAETRICVPGHMQRGLRPRAGDPVRLLRGRPCGGRALRRDRRHGEPPRHRKPAGRHCGQDPRCARRLRHAECCPRHGHQLGLILYPHKPFYCSVFCP